MLYGRGKAIVISL